MNNDPLQNLLASAQLQDTLFPTTSRYHGIGTSVTIGQDGTPVRHLRRRLIPSPEQFSLLKEHPIVGGDRLDNLAATYLGDPEQFWRLCDANGAMRPDELTETIGRRLRITLPEGIRGVV